MVISEVITSLKSISSDIKVEETINHSPLGNSGLVTVFPRTEEEIVSVVAFAHENSKKINVTGTGTKRGFGGQVEYADILLSLAEYTGIVEHTVGDMTLTVRSGTPFKEVQDYLAGHNQKISLDPAWPEAATVGGIIAANDSGPKRLGYGSARDLVIGTKIVYPDGSVIRTGGKVVKNVAGYDMNKLFIGSMGTLGILSEITFKLRPVAKYESLLLLSFPAGDLEQIRSFTVNLLDTMMEPISLELLSPTLAGELTNTPHYTLAISLEDVESSVIYQEEFIKKLLPSNTDMRVLNQQQADEFWKMFASIGPNGVKALESNQLQASLKVGVKNLDVLKVLQECALLQESNNLAIQSHGGLGHGLCQVHINGAGEDVIAAISSMRTAVKQLGGYVVVKHLPFAYRQTTSIWGDSPSYFFLLQGIKTKVDPKCTFNDKRFVGGI